MTEPRPRRRDASRNRELILAAALRLRTADRPASLEEVAAAAGVGIATLYRHFPSREALRRETSRAVFATEIEPLFELVDAASPRDTFLAISTRLLDVVARHGRVDGEGIDLLEQIRSAPPEFTAPFESLIRRGVESGELRSDLQVHDVVWMLHTCAMGFAVPEATADVRRRHLALLFDAVSAGGRTPLPAVGGSEPT